MAKFTKTLCLTAVLLAGVTITPFFLTNETAKPTVEQRQPATEPQESKQTVGAQREQLAAAVGNEDTSQELAITTQWRNYSTRDGLPSDKTHCVRSDGERIWIGTDAGLACYEAGRFRTYTISDGLAHPVVLAIDVSPLTGDVWIATMGGLNRWSAGKFEKFDQFNSGLANDVVYAVACQENFVWAATASGASRFDAYTQQWSIFNEKNAPMHEPWTYSVSAQDGMVYIAAWGGGVLEFNTKTEQWKDYRDPDGEMELDIFPNDGLVHDVTASVSYENEILWVGTYFGLNRFDGARWWGYFDHDSGLVSNFINFVKARGNVVWVCTDKGLNSFDGATWVTYRRAANGKTGEILISRDQAQVARRTSSTALAHNYILGVDFQDDTVWVATAKGVSRGTGRNKLAIRSP